MAANAFVAICCLVHNAKHGSFRVYLSSAVLMHYRNMSRSQTRTQKRPAPESPSPARPEQSDTPMIDYDLVAEKVAERLAQRLDSSDNKRDEQFTELKAQYTQLKANCSRQQSQIEALQNRVAFLEGESERRDQNGRNTNALLFNIPEERTGASPMDTVKAVLEKLSADGPVVDTPVACVRIGVPRDGSPAKPRQIKAIFTSADAKHRLLKRGKELRAKGLGVDVDLTPSQRAERVAKRDRYHALKGQNLAPFWRGSKLLYRQGTRIVEDHDASMPPPPPPPGSPPTYAQAAAASSAGPSANPRAAAQ